MTGRDRILVVGATGLLGHAIASVLRGERLTVRAMVRSSSDIAKQELLENLGCELIRGDLKDVPSLEVACRDVTTVVSTASATLSRQDGDSIETVDGTGQLALVDAAVRAGVKRFVFISFPPIAVDFALQRAKRSVEKRLLGGTMSFVVLQPAYFMEVWLSPALGFDPVNGKARVFGSGTAPVSWISLQDVAQCAASASVGGAVDGKVVPLGGPEAISPLAVLEIFRELGGHQTAVDYAPEAALQGQLAQARNSIEEAFAAIMLGVAQGAAVGPKAAAELVPRPMRTVRDHAKQLLQLSDN
jgi:uncharacterized protein YbjT (DUF2867 family)